MMLEGGKPETKTCPIAISSTNCVRTDLWSN